MSKSDINFLKDKMGHEKACYDNTGFVLTEKNSWISGEVSFHFFF